MWGEQMRIIANEIRKILNVKTIIFLSVITGIIYSNSIIPTEKNQADIFSFGNNVHIELLEKYGNHMDKSEYKDFLRNYDEKVKIADKYVKEDKNFASFDINNYEDYNKIVRNNGEEKYQNPKLQDLYYEYYYEKDDITIFRELGEMENIKITYEGNILESFESLYSTNQKAISRHKEIMSSEEGQSLLPYSIFEKYEMQIKFLVNIILISIMFIISPIYLKDKMDKVDYLQYTSKKGRRLFNSKIIAAVISTLIVTTANIGLFLNVCLDETSKLFLDCGISGYYNSPIRSWFDLSFKNYIVITLILVYLLSIVMTFVSLYISNKSSKYITAIGVQILIMIGTSSLLLKYILNNATSMYLHIRQLDYLTTWRYFIPAIYTIMIVAMILIMRKIYLKEKIKDI